MNMCLFRSSFLTLSHQAFTTRAQNCIFSAEPEGADQSTGYAIPDIVMSFQNPLAPTHHAHALLRKRSRRKLVPAPAVLVLYLLSFRQGAHSAVQCLPIPNRDIIRPLTLTTRHCTRNRYKHTNRTPPPEARKAIAESNYHRTTRGRIEY